MTMTYFVSYHRKYYVQYSVRVQGVRVFILFKLVIVLVILSCCCFAHQLYKNYKVTPPIMDSVRNSLLVNCEAKKQLSNPVLSKSSQQTMTPSTAEGDSCEFASMKYYALCGLGGILSCGITHTMVTPLDLVKCRLQVDPVKYKNVVNGFKVTVAENGVRGLALGWAPTFFGYSTQGLCKFGLYEVFKVLYSDMLGEENYYIYRTWVYLAASASAEFFADIGLSPMESAKVRIQTQPGFVSKLREAIPLIYKSEGLNGFYKSLVPLWCRQIPYTMMKFACFEKTVELLYKHVVPKPREKCTKGEQLVVTFAAGYIAGVFCAIVSHPADTVVSKLNQHKGASAMDVVKKIGFKGMWGGILPRIVMIGTLTAAQWFIYDAVKVSLRLPRPPPPEMPESLKQKLRASGELKD